MKNSRSQARQRIFSPARLISPPQNGQTNIPRTVLMAITATATSRIASAVIPIGGARTMFARIRPTGVHDSLPDTTSAFTIHCLTPAHTATLSAAVTPPARLPEIVASSRAEPSLNTLSLASVTPERFLVLPV